MPAKKPRTKAETAAAAMIFATDSVLAVDNSVQAASDLLLAVDNSVPAASDSVPVVGVGATEDGFELAVGSLDVH